MTFDKRLFFYLFISIVLSTIIGMLAHESGHWVTGKYYGCMPQLRYASTRLQPSTTHRRHHLIEMQYQGAIDSNKDFPLRGEYNKLAEEIRKEDIIITSAGPLISIAATLTGLLVLFLHRRKRNESGGLLIRQWLFVFLALFCIRGVVNLRTTFMAICFGHSYGHSDEAKLSRLFGWYQGTLPLITETITITTLLLLLLYFTPRRQRLTFFAALLLGDVAVLLLWMLWLGPILLP